MKDFLDDGNLFPGIHPYTVEKFEKQFIENFPSSITRKPLYDDFKIWLKDLCDIKPPQNIWLDGSYLTTKVNPNDIDLVVFYRPEKIHSLEMSEKLSEHIHETSRKYNCDAYLCLDVEHLRQDIIDEHFRDASIMVKYWMGQFTFDRMRKPKGLVEFTGEELFNWLETGGVSYDIARGQGE